MRSLAIARNTFREAIRDKIFALVGAFGLLLVLSSVVLSPLTVGAQSKIVTDVGLSSIALFSLLLVLLVGSGMVFKEIDKRTIMTILSKPISRLEYMLGKYLGLMSTLAVIVAAMSALFVGVIAITPAELHAAYFVAIYLTLCEMIVVTAVAMFFASFTTPVLTSLFTLGVVLVGHTLDDLSAFAEVTASAGVQKGMAVLSWVLPNLSLFNVRNAAVNGLPIETAHVMWATLYAVVYAGAMIAAGAWFFRRREFK